MAEAGKVEHPDAAVEKEASPVVVPPDPAVLLGYKETDKEGAPKPINHTNSAPL